MAPTVRVSTVSGKRLKLPQTPGLSMPLAWAYSEFHRTLQGKYALAFRVLDRQRLSLVPQIDKRPNSRHQTERRSFEYPAQAYPPINPR